MSASAAQITTAMILAAGRGERMRPLTDTTPKPLLQVAGRSLLERHLARLRDAGITRVVINHAWLGEQIVGALPNGDPWGIEIHFSAESPVQETAGGIVQALPLLGDKPFLLLNGDVYTDMDYRTFIDSSAVPHYSACHLLLVDNPGHNPEGDFALERGRVGRGNHRYTYAGVGVYDPALFTALPPGPRALGPLLKSWQHEGKVSGVHYPGYWCDVGTPERLQDIREFIATKEAI